MSVFILRLIIGEVKGVRVSDDNTKVHLKTGGWPSPTLGDDQMVGQNGINQETRREDKVCSPLNE